MRMQSYSQSLLIASGAHARRIYTPTSTHRGTIRRRACPAETPLGPANEVVGMWFAAARSPIASQHNENFSVLPACESIPSGSLDLTVALRNESVHDLVSDLELYEQMMAAARSPNRLSATTSKWQRTRLPSDLFLLRLTDIKALWGKQCA